MPLLIEEYTPEKIAARIKEWQAQFPSAKYGSLLTLRTEALDNLEKALETGLEEPIQRALSEDPYSIQYAIDHSGHHGIWAFPKQMIKPKSATGDEGLIPDFLVVTRSSLGYFWHIIELKTSRQQFRNRRGDGFSPEGNRAIAQCGSYLKHFEDYIDAIRSNIQVHELIQPKAAIIFMGDAESETENQNKIRANYNAGSGKIQVISYDRLRRGLQHDLGFKAAARANTK